MRISLLTPQADVPVYATSGSIAFDLTAVIDDLGIVEISPGDSHTFHTGVVAEVPAGTGLLLCSRSGHGVKQRLRLVNSLGLIDQDYRGELLVTLANDSRRVQRVRSGERIAQGLLVPVIKVESFEVVPLAELSKTERGAGGHGSTGK